VTISPTPQPAIVNITPNTAPANTTVNLTITGSNFANGAVVLFEGAQGPAPQVTTTQVVNPTTIVITVDTAVDTSFGTQAWDVRVTNPNNTAGVLEDAFTVTVTP
jgi:isocitrate/isopropylmalate dehydrogenase